MIDRLIRALEATRLDLSVEELADALWLARFLPEQQPAPTPAPEEPAPGEEPAPREKPAAPQASAPEAPGEAPAPVPPLAPLVLPGEQRASLHGVPLRVPAASALPDPLGLGRALRPLHRRVHSRRTQVIDEAASAEQIAETRVWLPVQRPEQVRWLDLALVVDTSTSMALWRQTVAELRDLLQFHGAFRNVRVWRLPTDSSEGELRLLAGLGTGEEPLVESVPDELIDPEGRRLVMVVSDCVSRRWHTGEVPKLLELWGRAGPVVVVQVLPEHYWGRTALRNGTEVLLRAPFRGAPNAQLLAEEDSGSDQEADAAPVVPVVTLEQTSLAAWANLVAGGSATVQGFELRSAQALSATSAGIAFSPSAQERLERFFATASLPARKLAGLLAAVPVSISVMNLIRETLVPEARQEHLAEVFLGGLLREPPGQEASTDPEEKLYDFWPDVRERLLDSLPAGSARNVLLRVSDFIADRFGQSRDFRAFLVDSTKDVTPFVEQHRAFATIAAHVLQRLGGAYSDLAQRLTTTLQAHPPEETKAETLQEPVAPPHPDDWAIVMGVDRYFRLSSLRNSESEAHAVFNWLVSPEGGGLPESQVLHLRSPTSEEFERHFSQMLQELSRLRERRGGLPVGRRIYLFLSGHGAESPELGPVLFLADSGPRSRIQVHGPQWARWFLQSGLFQEVILLMNCSRQTNNKFREAVRFPKLEALPSLHPESPSNFFFGFSTSPNQEAFERSGQAPDLFTAAVLDGLSGGAADEQGNITASSLQRFVSRRMAEHPPERPQVPEFEWNHATGQDFILTRVTPPPSRVRIQYHRAYHGLTARISNADQILVVTKASQSAKPIDLQRGSYKLELPQIARSWPLEVSGPEASLSADWAPSGLWVLVAGSAEPFHDKSPLAWICEALGETLARAGHGLLIGDQVGVAQRLRLSFEKTLREASIASPESLVQIAPSFSRLQSTYDKAVQRADAIVLMGGSGSTYALFERARAANKLVLPLGGVGGISEVIYKQLYSGTINSGQDRIRRMLEALNERIDSPVTAATVARHVAESLQTILDQGASDRWSWLRPGAGEQLRQLAREYERLRTQLAPGPERTRLLDDLLARIGKEKASLERLPPDVLARSLEGASAGERLVLLGLLLKQVDPRYFEVVHDILAHGLTAFEQYTALGVVGMMLEQLRPEQLEVLRDTLNRLRDTDALQLTSDSSRAHQVDTFLWEIQQLLGIGPPAATRTAKPSRAPNTEYFKKPLFAWVHLADLHIGPGREGHRRNQELVLHALHMDLAALHMGLTIRSTLGIPRPDAILVTGDISLTGDPRQYVQAKRWLRDLARTVSLDPRRVFTVPGNHDVQRNTHWDRSIDRLVHSLREGAEDPDEVLANKAERALLARRFESYLAFAEKFAPACLPRATSVLPDLSWMHRMEAHGGLRVRLVGFNTALLSSGDYDHGRLRLAQTSLDALVDPPPEVRELVLMLSHHAFNAGWFADEARINHQLRDRAHLHLSAHLHQTTTLTPADRSNLVRISAGTMHEEGPAYGYNIAAVYPTPEGSLILRVWPRVWSDKNKDFRTDADNVSPTRGFNQFSLPNIRVPVPA